MTFSWSSAWSPLITKTFLLIFILCHSFVLFNFQVTNADFCCLTTFVSSCQRSLSGACCSQSAVYCSPNLVFCTSQCKCSTYSLSSCFLSHYLLTTSLFW